MIYPLPSRIISALQTLYLHALFLSMTIKCDTVVGLYADRK